MTKSNIRQTLLGYGFNEKHIDEAMQKDPHDIKNCLKSIASLVKKELEQKENPNTINQKQKKDLEIAKNEKKQRFLPKNGRAKTLEENKKILKSVFEIELSKKWEKFVMVELHNLAFPSKEQKEEKINVLANFGVSLDKLNDESMSKNIGLSLFNKLTKICDITAIDPPNFSDFATKGSLIVDRIWNVPHLMLAIQNTISLNRVFCIKI
ncbi:hypothetical protein MHBO_001325 [Bonamia ostreae]|uniref:UBA domain-containing protein n=1 Tax=Bonamia ostreae TaxID=126728 RepID=A0ABV2AIJ9_9EUKA